MCVVMATAKNDNKGYLSLIGPPDIKQAILGNAAREEPSFFGEGNPCGVNIGEECLPNLLRMELHVSRVCKNVSLVSAPSPASCYACDLLLRNGQLQLFTQ